VVLRGRIRESTFNAGRVHWKTNKLGSYPSKRVVQGNGNGRSTVINKKQLSVFYVHTTALTKLNLETGSRAGQILMLR